MKASYIRGRANAKDISMECLAEKMGVCRETLYRWIRKDTIPLYALKIIIKELELNAKEILEIIK